MNILWLPDADDVIPLDGEGVEGQGGGGDSPLRHGPPVHQEVWPHLSLSSRVTGGGGSRELLP